MEAAEEKKLTHGNLALNGELILSSGEKILKSLKAEKGGEDAGILHITDKRVVFIGKIAVKGIVSGMVRAAGRGDSYISLPHKIIMKVGKVGWISKGLSIVYESGGKIFKKANVLFTGIHKEELDGLIETINGQIQNPNIPTTQI
jgi:hypothetical protein